jgi:hypothetical protein
MFCAFEKSGITDKTSLAIFQMNTNGTRVRHALAVAKTMEPMVKYL